MITLLNVLAAWLLADLITGIFHWFEDKYLVGNERSSFLRSIAADNTLHHDEPTAMTKGSYFSTIRVSAMVAWPISVALLIAGAPMIVWLAVFMSSFGNLIHRFSHEPRRNLSRFTRGMQEFGLFISPKHHATHHFAMGHKVLKPDADKAYCPMTDWLNPVLDKIKLWSRLESIVAFVAKPLKAKP